MKDYSYKLTSEQKNNGLNFQQKWHNILCSNKLIKKEESIQSIYQAYNILNLVKPKIIFCQSEVEAAKLISKNRLTAEIFVGLFIELYIELTESIETKIIQKFYSNNQFFFRTFSCSKYRFEDFCDTAFSVFFECIENDCSLVDIISTELSCIYLAEYDFLIEELNIDCNQKIWNTLKSLAQECPYIFSFEKICLVIEQPTQPHIPYFMVSKI